ncbi:M48 family metallopeptidase [Campylobacter insulaenigrae]|uniref:M48 family metallopeptidase n=1 Tax=Campylobacter insulaenigrae TaxID=260714 RepID=UPI0021524FC0|nr:SprT family zinc-dependent metalloprotease [Campylobacter insulaenigrae]MCR6574516.1 M48 family metallopeptidase [Campylobacter insulaenigrae]MCR6580442.1 M48 family metallopeptidase [Campylobacter insulaenigrae]MCR6583408.1 M48 family metallopeptidase [Campylobacter insulaenigrae]MCR6585475.1 M48 family metallopeptidase [Campylobacter insulaenigrae]
MAKQNFSIKGLLKFKEFNIQFEKKKVKYLRLKIDKKLNLKLTVPLHYENIDVFSFLKKNESWIRIKYKAISSQNIILNPNEIYFLGQKYMVIYNEKNLKTCIKNSKIFTKDIKTLEDFKKKSAKIIFEFLINKWQFAFEKKVQKISIKNMISRWGSCNHKKAYINLNLKLMQKPIKTIEYVILHELTHLIYPHHQKEFYSFLHNLMPDYKEREVFLKHF